MRKTVLIVISILLLTSIACSVSVNVPRVETGSSEVLEINEDYPQDVETAKLTVIMGGGTLNISAGGNPWVSGTIETNVPIWQPEINRRSDSLEITQQTKDNFGLPDDKVDNEWNLQIGDYPTELIIKAGAYQGKLDLGGIPLTNLEISDGASQADITFESLNPVVMQDLRYKTGASQINLEGLGNANFEEMSFEGGAGSYTLDFSGDLQRDADIDINYGLGDVKIIFPKGTNARIQVEGGLNNVELQGSWNIDGDEYILKGNGPLLDFRIKMGIGNLQLIVR
ncbi:MAG: hypothetical protein CVU39_10805 [Chloroflexi bacterium HGW-Chloroflexi-10]|nr:MAG: hypothetical protein CVU39_10805 [Chloroflexi bacterium HGW-Chloroflexi-10]